MNSDPAEPITAWVKTDGASAWLTLTDDTHKKVQACNLSTDARQRLNVRLGDELSNFLASLMEDHLHTEAAITAFINAPSSGNHFTL